MSRLGFLVLACVALGVACRRPTTVAPEPAVSSSASASSGSAEVVSSRPRIAVGNDFACTVRANGHVWCWGENRRCALGQPSAAHGASDPRPTPARVELPRPAVEVAAGNDWACAVLDDGTVRCWGSGTITGTHDAAAHAKNDCSPATVDLRGVRRLALGARNACALTEQGLRCWGETHAASRGICGPVASDGFTNPNPAEIVTPCGVPTGTREVAAVSISSTELCVLSTAGKVVCVSSVAESGKAKYGAVEQRTPPLRAFSLAASSGARCGVTTDGSFGCWPTPVGISANAYHGAWLPLPQVANAVAVAGAYVTSGAGAVYWLGVDGNNGVATLARGPTQVAVASVTELAAGGFGCVRTKDDSVWCFGSRNESGQLGAPLGGGPDPRAVAFPP